MERQLAFDNISNQYVARYDRYLENIRNSYNRTILKNDMNYSAITVFKKEVQNLTKIYVEKEQDEAITTQEQLIQWIEEDTANLSVNVIDDNEWSQYLEDNTSFLYDALKIQSLKDNLYANNFLRTKVIQLIAANDYKTAYNLVFDRTDMQFYYTDKIGRKINSAKYIRAIVRDYLIKNYNDLLAGAAMLNGLETLTIININPTQKDNGKTVSFVEGNGLNYFEVRDDLFHPNSNSILKIG